MIFGLFRAFLASRGVGWAATPRRALQSTIATRYAPGGESTRAVILERLGVRVRVEKSCSRLPDRALAAILER
jgi:hypothetical protein